MSGEHSLQWLERLRDDCVQLERDRGLRPRSRSVQELGRYLTDFVSYCGRHDVRSAEDLSPELLREFVMWRCAAGGPSALVKGTVWSLRKLGGFLTLKQMVSHNPAAGLQHPKSNPRAKLPRYLKAQELPIESLQRAREPYSGPVTVPTPAELHRLFEGVDRSTVLGVRDHLLFWLLYRLGLRLGEALAIDLADVDLANGTLQVHGKGRRERTLPLVDDVTDRIQEWLLLRQRLLRADREPALFLSKKGHRLSPRRAQEVFQAIVAEAGPLSVSRLTPHTLRHAFASHALEGDADLIVLKAIMGHARIKSTHLDLHPSMRLLRQAVNDHLASEVLATIIETNPAMMPIHRHRSREGPAAA